VFKRIRTKLAVVLAIPLVILVGVSYLEVFSSLRQSQTVSTQTDLATISIGPDGLVSSLQTERNQAALQVLGFNSKVPLGVANAAQARRRVDRASVLFRDSLGRHSANAAGAYRQALTSLDKLAVLRAQLDGYHGAIGVTSPEASAFAASLFDGYTGVLQTFFDANSRIATSVDNAQLRTGIELLDITLRQQEAESLAIRDAFLASFAGGLTANGQVGAFATDVAKYRDWTARLAVLATGLYAEPVNAYVDGRATATLDKLMTSYLQGTPIELGALLAASGAGTAPGPSAVTPGATLQKRLASLVAGEANHLRRSAQERLALFISLAIIAAALAIAVVTLASRSITRPLRRLAERADTMAKSVLPAAVQSILETPLGEDVSVPVLPPITVSTRDEVADVAAALTTVQDSAVALAVEQAVLRRNIADSFVNLGRRNQNLLGRQLDFITALEQKETDPDKLDELFRLDHLATRMRRNAESLLVLAGLESPRQWSAPVAVADIVRASLAEVENYRRVAVRQVDAANLPGRVAADVAHIIAELVENAITSSPPDTPVEVFGRASERDYQIVIVDRGVGMSREDLELANRRLAGSESFTVAPSRYLGHYVAGHLAARYNIAVSLQESDAGGIKAKVRVPAAVYDQARATGSMAPPPAPAPPLAAAPRPAPAPVPATPAPLLAARPVTTSALGNGNGSPPLPARNGVLLAEPFAPRVAPAAVALVESPSTPTEIRAVEAVGDAPAKTSAGLARRVPGASISDDNNDQLLRRDVDEAPSGDTSAHEVYRMLSSLWSDADNKTPPRTTPDRPNHGGEA
jgi:anti-sigma regulatory factor (Ser/Thr protein kinase)/methyl-accepting chemotaxis protein